jgi:hypothetical protein
VDAAEAALLLAAPWLADRLDEPCLVVAGRWGPHEAFYRTHSHLDERLHGWITVGDLLREFRRLIGSNSE